MRNPVCNQLPGLTKVGCFVDPRVAIVLLMAIDSEVSGASVVARSFDVADRALRQHIGNIPGNVRPGLAAIASDLHLAIIRARPNRAG